MEKIKNFFKKIFTSEFFLNNWSIIISILIMVILEFTSVAVTAGGFYIKKPWLFFSIMLVFGVILYYIRNVLARFVTSAIFIATIFTINIIFIVVYEMTGQVFDYTMLKLRSDAFGILESLPINFIYFFTFFTLYSAYMVFGCRAAIKSVRKLPQIKRKAIVIPVSAALSLGLLTLFITKSVYVPNFYDELLYSTDSHSYNDKGITANTLSELLVATRGTSVELGNEDDLTDYIYNDISISKHQKNKGFNVVTVLCETLEWMAFMQNKDIFPNGLDLVDPTGNNRSCEVLERELFPNIYEYLDSSVVFDNFHSKEKTDMSENYSYLGVYPTRSLTNYDFCDNTIANSMANTLKALDSNITCNAFHNGITGFYNRDEYELAAGFDTFIGGDEMAQMGMPDWQNDHSERNLDSEMIETCADLMFPTDKRFYTHIVTISMHGQYTERTNFIESGYYEKLKEYGLEFITEKNIDDQRHNAFVTYVAGCLEFDKAIGKIRDELTNRGLIDNTVITLFGDHNCYYSSLSNYVKDIENNDYNLAMTKNQNYTELYRVPCIMRIPGEGHKVMSKFTCTADIVPSVYDAIGINTFSNLLYGNSVFANEESVLYSRAYNFFCTDKVLFTSLNSIKFSLNGTYDVNSIDENQTLSLKERTIKLVNKIEVIDKIFYNDYFALDIKKNSKSTVVLNNKNANMKTYQDLYNYMINKIN